MYANRYDASAYTYLHYINSHYITYSTATKCRSATINSVGIFVLMDFKHGNYISIFILCRNSSCFEQIITTFVTFKIYITNRVIYELLFIEDLKEKYQNVCKSEKAQT